MKKLVLLILLLVASISISATEVRLTNGVSFEMPEGYEYFKYKNLPYSAKRGQDVLFMSAMHGDQFNKEVLYTSADTMFHNISRTHMVCEEHSSIWRFTKKYVKRYYKFSDNLYAVTYTCHTESKAGFVMLASYSTTKQLKELEQMFKSIRLVHKNFLREFVYTLGNGAWILFIILFIMLCISMFIPKNSWGEIILAGGGLALLISLTVGMKIYTLIAYIVCSAPIFLLYTYIEDHLPEHLKRNLQNKNQSGNNSEDDGGDDGGDESSGNEHAYIASDDGSYYNPIDF
jgi:hypothetical protein